MYFLITGSYATVVRDTGVTPAQDTVSRTATIAVPPTGSVLLPTNAAATLAGWARTALQSVTVTVTPTARVRLHGMCVCNVTTAQGLVHHTTT